MAVRKFAKPKPSPLPPVIAQDWFTIPEALEAMRISKGTFHRYAKEGMFERRMWKNLRLVSKKSVDAVLRGV